MSAPRWIQQVRQEAAERFAALGYPTSQLEEWKFTSVAPIARIPFQPAPRDGNGVNAAALERVALADLGCPRLAFVNGWFSPALSRLGSLPSGVRAGSLAEAIEGGEPALEQRLARYAGFQDHAFVAFNTSVLGDGAFIEISRGAVVETPIQLLFLSAASGAPAVSHPRNLILAGRGSQASIIETYLSLTDQVHFTNVVTEIELGENAVIEHYKVQQENKRSFHVATLQARQNRSSSLTSHSVSLGAAIARHDLNSRLDAEGAECILNGLYAVGGAQHVDNHTTLDHAQPHCSSRELYKGILDGRSAAVFNGKIIVRQDAQKTDSKQTNKNLLLSEDAAINTKPQLEIYADDVKCTHGATIGQLGDEALFYLRSRGIAREEARALLTYAFASELIGRLKVEPLRARLDSLVLDLLRKPA